MRCYETEDCSETETYEACSKGHANEGQDAPEEAHEKTIFFFVFVRGGYRYGWRRGSEDAFYVCDSGDAWVSRIVLRRQALSDLYRVISTSVELSRHTAIIWHSTLVTGSIGISTHPVSSLSHSCPALIFRLTDLLGDSHES